MEYAQLSNRFIGFALECATTSELYASLARFIASDPELLAIASCSKAGQPAPNLFLGAVHYLLLQKPKSSLSSYYASLAGNPKTIDSALYPLFKSFCLDNRESIVGLLRTKLVQTNEAGRCAYLYPCFCLIYDTVQKPLALIEIGTSAGLQLLWDQYSYSYSHASRELYGNRQSAVHLQAEVRGSGEPFLKHAPPPVAARIGIDLHPNRQNDAEHYDWLQALIWPEHNERRELFEKAAACVREQSLQLIEADAVTCLPIIAESIPEDAALCIFHTHVANQFTPQAKQQLLDQISELGFKRDVFHLYNNICDKRLHLDYFISGEAHHMVMAETEGHGRWLEWLAKDRLPLR